MFFDLVSAGPVPSPNLSGRLAAPRLRTTPALEGAAQIAPIVTAVYPLQWNTGTTVPGTYAARASLRESGALVADASDALEILPSEALAGSVRSDKTSYLPGETVSASWRIVNESPNVALEDLVVSFEIVSPSGASVQSFSRSYSELLVGADRADVFEWDSTGEASGTYLLMLSVTVRGTELLRLSSTFEIADTDDPAGPPTWRRGLHTSNLGPGSSGRVRHRDSKRVCQESGRCGAPRPGRRSPNAAAGRESSRHGNGPPVGRGREPVDRLRFLPTPGKRLPDSPASGERGNYGKPCLHVRAHRPGKTVRRSSTPARTGRSMRATSFRAQAPLPTRIPIPGWRPSTTATGRRRNL